MKLILGNCLNKLKELQDNSIDSIITDPPYGLKFMNKKWDYNVPSVEIWKECLRVLKPGGHLLSFGGTRTYHRMVINIEDAGFEIRDQIMWVYGSGFPKSHNISKAIDKMKGAERKVISEKKTNSGGFAHMSKVNAEQGFRPKAYNGHSLSEDSKNVMQIIIPSTPEAKQYEGWGTALKPAHEPIVLAKKPISEKTITKNVLEWGTGGINIDKCRVSLNGDYKSKPNGRPSQTGLPDNYNPEEANKPDTIGRFPANFIHDGSEEVINKFPNTKSGAMKNKIGPYDGKSNTGFLRGDSGSASRFFYCAKASRKERNVGLEGLQTKTSSELTGRKEGSKGLSGSKEHGNAMNPYANGGSVKPRANYHPTVKPITLMQYLVRLITPKNGIVLDPFMGSGSTGVACIKENFDFVGIELEKDYLKIAEARIKHEIKE